MEIERRKPRRIGGSILLALITTLLTSIYGIYSAIHTARLQVQSRIAEAILTGNDAAESIERAKLALAINPDLVTTGAEKQKPVEKLNPKDYPALNAMSAEAKASLLDLLTKHPTQREQVLTDWIALFPTDKEAQTPTDALPKNNQNGAQHDRGKPMGSSNRGGSDK